MILIVVISSVTNKLVYFGLLQQRGISWEKSIVLYLGKGQVRYIYHEPQQWSMDIYSYGRYNMQQLGGQNFAIFWPTPLPAWRGFIFWTWTKTPTPHLVHVDIEWPLGQKFLFQLWILTFKRCQKKPNILYFSERLLGLNERKSLILTGIYCLPYSSLRGVIWPTLIMYLELCCVP